SRSRARFLRIGLEINGLPGVVVNSWWVRAGPLLARLGREALRQGTKFMFPTPHRRLPGRGWAVLLLLTAFGPLCAEDMSNVYTHAQPPPRDALERLNLKIGWSAYLPVEGMKDGLFSVQVLEKEILVQTKSGLVLVMDAETGKTKWKVRVGMPFRVPHQLGYNSKLILVVNQSDLFALDRSDGRTLWVFRMPGGPTAPPHADDEQLYLTAM